MASVPEEDYPKRPALIYEGRRVHLREDQQRHFHNFHEANYNDLFENKDAACSFHSTTHS